MQLTQTFLKFVQSEKSAGLLLIVCTAVSLALANSTIGPAYAGFWQQPIAGLSLEHWINDGLMAVFFLLIGLELQRELHSGELADFRKALLPVFAAVGGMAAPALIHFSLNAGTPAQSGFGIPMATDIAFSLGVLALLGSRLPASLKVFVVAFAVIDDLGAIILIATVYTAEVSTAYLLGAIAVWIGLAGLKRVFHIMSLTPYLIGGILLWFLMQKSGVHATIAGVLLAFAIPVSPRDNDGASPSHKLEGLLHYPVAYLILPIFALANTAVAVEGDWMKGLAGANSLGVVGGLVVGKPLGIMITCGVAVAAGICKLPADLRWGHIFGAGLLGGIGFTMSIFITNLAFAGSAAIIDAAKIAILAASLVAAISGYIWLRWLPGNSTLK